jgi:polar amino acid transport system substrate-binding protein
VAAVVTLGGPGGGPAGGGTGTDRATVPPQAPAPLPASAPADESCRPRASYRPPDPLPRPGHMPAGSTMAAIVQRGRLIAGVDQNSYLFGYRNPLTGDLDGYEIQVVRRISQALFGSPDRVQFRTFAPAQRISVLTDDPHPVDLVIDSMTMNCDRWKQVAFSTDYMDAGQRVLVPRSSTARSVRDLGGKRICAAGNTTSIAFLATLRPTVVPVAANDWTECLMRLQLGTVDAVSTDDTILMGLAEQDPATRLIGPRLTGEPHGIAMRPAQTDFVRFVNGVLEQMRQDGSLAGLAKQWLGQDAAGFGPPAPEYRD